MQKVLAAVNLATLAHAGQIRKFTGIPYITHPLAVAQILLNHGFKDEDVIAAAICHDVVEDTQTTLKTIEKVLGPIVAQLVDQVTDRFKDPVHGNRATRKALEIKRIADCTGAWAQNIKIADAIHNMTDMAGHDPEFAKQYIGEKAELFKVLKLAHPGLREAGNLTVRSLLAVIGQSEALKE